MTSTHPPQGRLAATIPAPGIYRVDPARSSLTFTTRHRFGLGRVSGSFQVRSGSVTITAPVAGSGALGEVVAGSFDTGLAARDEKVRSKMFLDAANFPVISFRSAGLRRSGSAWVLGGLLTVRGVEASIEFVITRADIRTGELTVSAEGTVDRYRHGITAMKGMVGRRLWISLTVTATCP